MCTDPSSKILSKFFAFGSHDKEWYVLYLEKHFTGTKSTEKWDDLEGWEWENIKIWEDPWIPREWTRRPTTQRGRHLLNRVCELIDPYTNGWDVDLVLQMFNEDDAKAILAIPVHPDLEDTVAWHFDNRGVFSVRLAYKVPKSFERRNCRKDMASTAGNAGSVQNEWKKLWNLKCPSKLKHFLWRLAHNSLALRVKLGGKGMDIDTQCVICQRFDEDGGTYFSNAKK